MPSGRLAVLSAFIMSIEDRLVYDQGWLAKGEWLMLAELEAGGGRTKADSCARAAGTPAAQRACEPWQDSSLLQPAHGGAAYGRAGPRPCEAAAAHAGRPEWQAWPP